jgi:hypothetical protein
LNYEPSILGVREYQLVSENFNEKIHDSPEHVNDLLGECIPFVVDQKLGHTEMDGTTLSSGVTPTRSTI